MHGPYAPERGLRFNPSKLLIDPYARALAGGLHWNDELFGYRVGDPAGDLMTAWLFLDARGRRLFRRELTEFDDAAWARARGWALEISVLALARPDTNSFVAGFSRHALDQLLAERAG